jgi:hypothetical protein
VQLPSVNAAVFTPAARSNSASDISNSSTSVVTIGYLGFFLLHDVTFQNR